jgi:hypothetical protein
MDITHDDWCECGDAERCAEQERAEALASQRGA